MTAHDIYIFLLCLVVFTLLTALFSVLITYIVRLLIRIIRGGLEDKAIIEEYEKEKSVKENNSFWDSLFSTLFCVAMFAVFAFSLCAKIDENKVAGGIPQFRVVLSQSMSKKYEKNDYLFKNNLNDQFDMFDLIVTEKLPDEFDLELYDIVVYEVDDSLVVHRIVEIEEPNEKHPNERWFRLQGDFVQYQDKFPVKYEQMKAIYTGTHIPFVGSFFAFMQSPAGYLCILLVLFGVFAVPYVERKIGDEREKRWQLIISGQAVSEAANAYMGKTQRGYKKRVIKVMGVPFEQIATATVVEPQQPPTNGDLTVNVQFVREDENGEYVPACRSYKR